MRRRCSSPASGSLKVKRAVRFPFLDYLHAREAQGRLRDRACDQPPHRAGHLSPRRRRSRARRTDGWRSTGSGEPVEWAVEMRRFDESLTLDHLAAAGKIDAALADALGRAVAAVACRRRASRRRALDRRARKLHRRARRGVRPRRPTCSRPIENRALADAEPRGLRAHPAAARRARAAGLHPPHPRRPASRQHRPARRQAGAVRRHRVQRGDRVGRRALRSRLPADGPGRARSRRRRRTSCSTAISSNRERDEDLDALAALPFFLSMRAAIRAKVTAARLERAKPDEQPEIARIARTVFRLGAPLHRAGAAGDGRGRRTVRHRQVGAGARAGARARAAAGRGRAALRCRAQGACSARMNSSRCRRTPTRRRSPRGSMPRSPRRRGARSPPAIRPSSTPCSRGRTSARTSSRPRRAPACRSQGLFLEADVRHARSRGPARAARCLRRRRRRRARAGGLRSRHARPGIASTPRARRTRPCSARRRRSHERRRRRPPNAAARGSRSGSPASAPSSISIRRRRCCRHAGGGILRQRRRRSAPP